MDTEEKLAVIDKEAKRFATVLSNLGMKHVSFSFIAKESSSSGKDYCSVFQVGKNLDFDRTFYREGKKWQ